ncbi:MAG: sulfatase-like hydrolase/transferase [Terriglobia bacterium]
MAISTLIPFQLEAAETRPNVIIITIDTLRADHLACYGYRRIQTPNIDSLASTATRFSRAYTPVPITLPAHTALFTGSFPMATGVHDFAVNKVPASAVTLAEILRQNGYATGAFIGAPVLDSTYGLNQGFETYFDNFDFSRLDEARADEIKRRGNIVVDEALSWLKQTSRRPFFLWAHLYDPHYPYTPPEPFATQYRDRPYDGEIAFADAQVGRLMAFLKETGSFTDSVVVLASDHGEGLGDHGENKHGFFIYNSTIHVPLLVKVPGAKPRLAGEEVSLVDVMPTVLQILRIAIPPSVQGRSLLSQILGRPAASSSNIYAESFLPLLHFSWSQLRSLQWRGLKYIEAPHPELYDTVADPRETKNLFDVRQADAHLLRDRLFTILRRYTPVTGETSNEKALADPALLERLQSLGYVAISSGTFADNSGKALPDPKDRIQVYELFWEAMAAGTHGRYEESLRKLREAEKLEPDSLPILFLTALDYFQMKNYPQAIGFFNRILILKPKYAPPYYYLGVIYAQGSNIEVAVANFKKALELDRTNFSAAFGLGAAYLKVQRVDDAAAAFQQAVQINPNYAEAYAALGEIYLNQQRLDDAIDVLEKAVKFAPRMSVAHLRLGQAYEAKGLADRAAEEFRRAKSPQ